MKTYTPSNNCMISCINGTDDYVKKSDIEGLLTKASYLAESILMSWKISDQVELAKEVAIEVHEIFTKEI